MSDNAIILAMETHGGAFVKRLAAAWRVADPENKQRIKATWPEYWEKYAAIVEYKEGKG